MKIAILTLPLHINYGGIVQAYALQTYLKKCGHEPWIINCKIKNETVIYYVKMIFKTIMNIKKREDNNRINSEIKNKDINCFIRKFINPMTFEVRNITEFKFLERYNFDAYIVGSDQVWREEFQIKESRIIAKLLPQREQFPFFLDFVTSPETIKITYAASFGVDTWDYNKRKTERISTLLKMFDAISVREDSGVVLCKKYLNVEATHLIDPTLLLSIDDYKSLFEEECTNENKSTMMVYLFNKDKKCVVDAICRKVKLPKNEILVNDINTNCLDLRPSVSSWLKGFYDAQYVVTDSFHGCVFSILFNKPFIAIDNKRHDTTRMYSLLRQFNLQNRMVMSIQDLTDEKINEKINFKSVNEILEAEKQKAYRFFDSNLIKKSTME